MNNVRGNLFVLTGPSGAGKGTVISEVLQRESKLHYSVSATTRSPRTGEVDGKSYFFISREKFLEMISRDVFLEYAEYVGNYYGTPKHTVFEKLDQGIDVLLEIDIQGARKVKNSYGDAVMIFIMPPTFSELESRLRGRATEAEEVVRKRLNAAKMECKDAKHFDYVVINDVLENAVLETLSIIRAERCKYKNRKFLIEV